MYTGEDNFDQVGQIGTWNYNSTVNESIYTDKCAEIVGSAGEFFPPNRDKTFVEFFTSDLCR